MNPLQEQFFDESYAQTLQSLGINMENEKVANWLTDIFKRSPTLIRGGQMKQDITRAAKANAPKQLYKADPMADVVSAHRYAKKKDVDLNQLYTGQKAPGSIADQIPQAQQAGPQTGMWDKTKAWWGQRSPWAKAGIGAAAALPIGMGLYAAGGENPSPRTPRYTEQQYPQPPIQQY